VTFAVGDGGALDQGALAAALDAAVDATKPGAETVLLWCHPHNPTGRVWRPDEMAFVARACAARGVVLVSDEVWAGLIYDPAATPFVSAGSFLETVPGLRAIVLTAPSKTYNVAGLAVALAVIPDDALRRRYFRVGRSQAEVPAVGLAAVGAVLAGDDGSPAPFLAPPSGDCEPWRRELLAYLAGNRDRALAFIERECGPELSVAAAPEASFLLWIDAAALAKAPGLFLKKRGVYLTEGVGFGARGHVRLNFGCHRSTLDEGLARLRDAVGDARLLKGRA
jgi:cystathionine beta-lyase